MPKLAYLLLLLAIPNSILAADLPAQTGTVDINTASVQQLDRLIGIGPALAQKIIDARPYASLDGLLRVKGIGEKTLQEIKNQGLAYVLAQPPTPAPAQTTANTPLAQPPAKLAQKPITYPSGVVINEILPAPEGPDETDEWIELYNQNEFKATLSGWKLKDSKGSLATYVFPKTTTIPGGGYLVLKRPQTKITLNNDQDSLNLIFPDGKVTSTTNYTKAPKNQSYNKTESGWAWNNTQTPGTLNAVNPAASLLKEQKSDNNTNSNIAGLSQATGFAKYFGSSNNPWLLFIVALVIAIASGVIMLIVRLKYKNHVRTQSF